MDYLVATLLPQLLHGLVFGAALGLLALGLTVIFGLLGTFTALGRKPAQVLRNL